MLNPVYNFCAGPAALPAPVMQKAQKELLNWKGLGVSVMEVSHRSTEYQEIAHKAESDLRKLLNIDDSHAVLFMHGGASLQFSNIPMCLLAPNAQAEYIQNGIWSGKAGIEAKRYGHVHTINALKVSDNGIRSLSTEGEWQRAENSVYTHYTPNETIEGMRFKTVPHSQAPVIADMSSCILAEEINVNDFDMMLGCYAGAQKNIGPAGMTIAIIKHQLIDAMNFDRVPKVYNYKAQVEQGSMVNTPPTYTWYLAGLVFEWLLDNGGVAEMARRSKEKSSRLYEFIDQDDFYHNPINAENRSLVNIPFILKDNSLNSTFVASAEKQGLVGLKGHRSVGGMRASLYNSMPVEGVDALISFMQEFKKQYG